MTALPKSAPPLGKAGQSATTKSVGRKQVLWAGLFLATLLFLGSYISVIAYVRFGGQAIKDFCGQGKTIAA